MDWVDIFIWVIIECRKAKRETPNDPGISGRCWFCPTTNPGKQLNWNGHLAFEQCRFISLSRILHQLFHIKWLKIYRKCSTRCSFLICCLSEISSTGCLAFFCKESLLLFSSGSVEVCAGAGGPLPPPAKPQKPLKDTTTRLGTQQKYNKEI